MNNNRPRGRPKSVGGGRAGRGGAQANLVVQQGDQQQPGNQQQQADRQHEDRGGGEEALFDLKDVKDSIPVMKSQMEALGVIGSWKVILQNVRNAKLDNSLWVNLALEGKIVEPNLLRIWESKQITEDRLGLLELHLRADNMMKKNRLQAMEFKESDAGSSVSYVQMKMKMLEDAFGDTVSDKTKLDWIMDKVSKETRAYMGVIWKPESVDDLLEACVSVDEHVAKPATVGGIRDGNRGRGFRRGAGRGGGQWKPRSNGRNTNDGNAGMHSGQRLGGGFGRQGQGRGSNGNNTNDGISSSGAASSNTLCTKCRNPLPDRFPYAICSQCFQDARGRCFRCNSTTHLARDCTVARVNGILDQEEGTLSICEDDVVTVKAKINGKEERVMLDTGSSVTLVSDRIRGDRRMKCYKRIRYANGMLELLEWKVRLHVLVCGKFREIWAYESKGSLPVGLLIGTDYMKGKISIDMSERPYVARWKEESGLKGEVCGITELDLERKYLKEDYRVLEGLEGRWKELILKNIDRFEKLKESGRFVVADLKPLRIKMEKECSVFMKPIRYYDEDRKFINEKFREWGEQGVVVPSSSRTAVSVVVNRKEKAGVVKRRACGNYKPVNRFIVQEPYPLPKIKDIINETGGSELFAVIDYDQGHLRMPLDERDRHVTAVILDESIVGLGDHLEFTSMPWGLVNSGREMQRVSDDIIRPKFRVFSTGEEFTRNLKGDGASALQDDILLYGKSKGEKSAEDVLFENVRELLERMYACRLMPGWNKCVVNRSQVKYGGYLVSAGGVSQDPEKVKVLSELRFPENRKELMSFIGLLTDHRRFVLNLAKEMAVLEELKTSSANRKFVFGREHELAFMKCIELVKNAVMLRIPEGNGQLIVEVDACKLTYTVSATLKQVQKGGEVVLGYASKRLGQKEREKGVPFLEFSAVHYGSTYFRDIVRGRKLVIRTDHLSLKDLNLKNPTGRWLTMLGEITESGAEVEYIEGEKNCSSDAQTRLWVGENTVED